MASPIVEPGNDNSTHDILLTDGRKKVGIIITDSKGNPAPNLMPRSPVQQLALKTTSGASEYSDFNYPWTPVAQSDFSGGIGKEDFDGDTTRYWYGVGVNTMNSGKVLLGGRVGHGVGAYKEQVFLLPCGSDDNTYSLPNGFRWVRFTGATVSIPESIHDANYTVFNTVGIYVRRRGTPPAPIDVQANWYKNRQGVCQITIDDIPDTTSTLIYKAMTNSILGSDYLPSGLVTVAVSTATAGDEDNHWEIGHWYWETTSYKDAFFHLMKGAHTGSNRTLFFDLKGAKYMVTGEDAAGTPADIYINGDRGVADSNAADKTALIDATKSWELNKWAGAVVKVIAGKGSQERVPWRYILSNDATSLYVHAEWITEHDTTTEYIIYNTPYWTLVDNAATTGMTQPATSVMVVNNNAWIAQANGAQPRRFEWYNNSGTATNRYQADTGTTAPFLSLVRDTSGKAYIFAGYESSGLPTIGRTAANAIPAWGSNMSLASTLTFRDNKGRITGLREYEDKLFVMREGGVDTVDSTPAIVPLKLGELSALLSENNGTATALANVYLYFNLGLNFERYYNGLMDDIGPSRDDGLPLDCYGIISSIITYPGMQIIAIDGGESNYSSIMAYKSGWHVLFRSPQKGMRITTMSFQAIPSYSDADIPVGANWHIAAPFSRLWFDCGSDVLFIPFSSDLFNTINDPAYPFIHEGYLETGWIYAGLKDAYKQFQALRLFTERLEPEGNTRIEADYKTDGDTDWTPINGYFDESPVQGLDFGDFPLYKKRRIKYRLRFMSSFYNDTPILKTGVVKAISQQDVKYSHRINYLNSPDMETRQGENDVDGDTRQAIIDQWAEELTPLLMRSRVKKYDRKKCFISPTTTTIVDENLQKIVEDLVITYYA